jgi:NAD(P)-dependent dehydrogenase (short-subunit alcohol dehydrogenase family)
MTTSDSSPIAVVTGGSRGIGRATALALSAHGIDPIITYNNNEAAARDVVVAAEALGRRAVALQLDTTDVASFPAFVEALREHLPHGTFDVLVNNAGTAMYAPFAETTEQQFDEVFDIHVKGPFFLTQSLLPLLADGGQIINISSGLARIALPGSAVYGTAKGAVEVLTRYQALELGTRGITANVIAPGAVPTDFGDGHLRGDEGLQEAVVGQTALGRLATAEDVGQAIAGLVTASGRWITGQRIEASGGLRL